MKQLWSPQELDDFWLFTDAEIASCTSVYSGSRLAVALQLKYLEHEGRFPRHKGEISAIVIRFVARQLDASLKSVGDYDWGGRSTRRYRADIRECLGYRKPTVEDADNLRAHLVKQVLPHDASRAVITEAALAWHRERALRHHWRTARAGNQRPVCLSAISDWLHRSVWGGDAERHRAGELYQRTA